ncbi:MAG: DUF4421 family protein, partial [Paludibacteraceae bacterium]
MRRNMCRRFILFIFLFFVSLKATANLIDDFKAWEDKVFYNQDTNYVKVIPREFSVKMTSSSWMDFYQVNQNRRPLLRMRSDLISGVAASVGYGIFSLSYSVGVNRYFSNKDYDCRRFDFNMCWNKISMEFGYARNESDRTIFSYGDDDSDESIPYSGLRVNMYKARILYFFNNKRYSNDAIYSDFYRLRQVHSVGSFIAGVSYAYHDMKLDLSRLPLYIELPDETSHYEYYDYCVNVGYGYNLVFAKGWLLNFTIIPELGCKVNDSYEREYQFAINN